MIAFPFHLQNIENKEVDKMEEMFWIMSSREGEVLEKSRRNDQKSDIIELENNHGYGNLAGD